MRFFLVAVTATLLIMLWSALPVEASPTSFNKNLIVYDDEFEDWQTLSAAWIQAFLNSQPGILKSYSVSGKPASQIIYEAAQTYRLSPKVILANIQKESSMVTRTTFPSGRQFYLDWIMFYGWCDSCSTGSQKGFVNQIIAASNAFRRYLNNIAATGHTGYGPGPWGPGIPSAIRCIDSDYNSGRQLCTPGTTTTITPVNRATAALYTYTPHPGGNYAFWKIWRQFRFDLLRKYPDGTLIRAERSPNVWLIQAGQKRRFTNSAAFLSRYTFSQVIAVPPDHLWLYRTGTEISYANYSLLSSPEGGVYLLVGDRKRPIVSRAAFQNAGFRWEEVVRVSWRELNKFPDGDDITTDNVYPSGRLLQNNRSGVVYFVQDGVRHPIACREMFRSQFGLRRPQPVAPAELERYQWGSPVGFKDGDLVTAGRTAYVISKGKKLPIADPATYNAYGFSWGNLQLVPAPCVDIHPTGRTLDATDPVRIAGH
ncbi:MAG: hypothetical protein HYY50_02885 [Candidatus Kerfeldbacteria bacterium]|nr:hypothetical protein [Candidatus Kerfeldbacteria bacterium]